MIEGGTAGRPVPRWKQRLPPEERSFYERHREVSRQVLASSLTVPALAPQVRVAGGTASSLDETIMHFRPSGIRAKRPDYVPALVAITQTSILGKRRRATPRETARLQGLPDWFEFRQSATRRAASRGHHSKDAASYKQMGNGVNVGAAYYVFTQYVLSTRARLRRPRPTVSRSHLTVRVVHLTCTATALARPLLM